MFRNHAFIFLVSMKFDKQSTAKSEGSFVLYSLENHYKKYYLK